MEKTKCGACKVCTCKVSKGNKQAVVVYLDTLAIEYVPAKAKDTAY